MADLLILAGGIGDGISNAILAIGWAGLFLIAVVTVCAWASEGEGPSFFAITLIIAHTLLFCPFWLAPFNTLTPQAIEDPDEVSIQRENIILAFGCYVVITAAFLAIITRLMMAEKLREQRSTKQSLTTDQISER